MLRKILPQVIAFLFLGGLVAYAWQEPGSAPPGGNVDAPINVSGNDQTFLDTKTLWMKSDETGAMNLNGAFNVKGVSQFLNDAFFGGKIGANMLELPEISSPAVPSSGKAILYIDTADKKIKMKKSDGSVIVIGGARTKQIFNTSGPFSFAVPEGITSLDVTIAGGGGGGGAGGIGCSSGMIFPGGGGGGGGGGQAFQVVITVVSGNIIGGNVGAGGSGGAPYAGYNCTITGAAGGGGGSTSFGTFTASGGMGGSVPAVSGGSGGTVGGAGGAAGGGGGFNGAKGMDGSGGLTGLGGAGGATIFLPYGSGGVGGTGYGATGTTCYNDEGSQIPCLPTGGLYGANGVVIIEY